MTFEIFIKTIIAAMFIIWAAHLWIIAYSSWSDGSLSTDKLLGVIVKSLMTFSMILIVII